MSNMSYCRFRNTLSDFRDCANALEEMGTGERSPLSRDELEAAKQLASEALSMVQNLAERIGKDVSDELDDDDMEKAVAALQEDASAGETS